MVTLVWLLNNGDGFPKDFKKSLSSSLLKCQSDCAFLSDLFLRLPNPPNAVGISVGVHIACMMLSIVSYIKSGCSFRSLLHVVVANFVTVLAEHTPLVIS